MQLAQSPSRGIVHRQERRSLLHGEVEHTHDVWMLQTSERLSFREELHAIEAVIAGQGVGIFSDVLVAEELAAGTLAKAFELGLSGYRFYLVHRPGNAREKTIRRFSAWLQSIV